MTKYLAIDVGGTAIKYALMDEEAEIIEKGETPTPYEGLEVFIDTIVSIYEKYAGQVEALVMSAPGKIDAINGYFYTSGALKYISGVNLKDRLAERIPVPFAVENDAKAAALAELWKGSMAGIKNGSVIVLGTGIGGAVIINGALFRGTTFAAGEYSNIATNWRNPEEEGGGWHAWASTTGLVRLYSEKTGIPASELNGRVIFDAVNSGDETANAVLDEFAYYVASGIFSLQVIMDLECYSIGGGISKQPVLLEKIREQTHRIFESKPGSPMTEPEVVVCTFGNDANMIGALYHYLFELKA